MEDHADSNERAATGYKPTPREIEDFIAKIDEDLDQKIDPATAEHFLEIGDGNINNAFSFFLDYGLGNGLENPVAHSSSAAATSSNPAAASSRSQDASRTNIGRQDDAGVIHIDDDDDDIEFDDFPDDNDVQLQTGAADNAAQLATDEAFARRMQEEFYGGMDEDAVRAPIARTTETLVAPGAYGGGWTSAAAPPDEYDEGGRTQLLASMRRAAAERPTGPSIWDADEEPDAPAGSGPAASTFATAAAGAFGAHARRLADLFSLPPGLNANLRWDDARDIGKLEKKWLLVDMQDGSFFCQAIVRDLWKDDKILALLKENFIFLQYMKGDHKADQYSTFYFSADAQKNPDNFPHVAIVDPRTGELSRLWSGDEIASQNNPPSAQKFHAQLVEFLDTHSLDDGSKNPVAMQKAPKPVVDVHRLTEDEQMELAMANSLGEAKGKGKAIEDYVMKDAPREEEPIEEEPSEEEQHRAVFAAIAADRPHEEPAKGNGITTIQFRHSDGRIIRRFAITDRVRRIYEWLKAEKGVSFELKTMPAGKDLVEDLEKTIEEAKLGMSTVLIEYVD